MSPATAPTVVSARRIRPEIQGLRAVAVSVVVLYHLGLPWFSGGYVGVDVFFVISGFLITSHIAGQLDRTGRLGLGEFWARRARRLLPAALLVLAVCLVLTRLILPSTLWDQSFRQIIASTFYVENWALARDAVDYSALGNTPTLVQHYWSLSVEEQFYIVWPLLIVVVLLLIRRSRWLVPSRTVLMAIITVVTSASLIWSIVATNTDAGRAYFDTGARMWEFGLGALLALGLRSPLPKVLGWVGLLAIAWSAVTYSHATAFPGHSALLPVLGAVLVIGAGGSTSTWSADRLLSQRPAVFIGDISYAVYLWHWPLIIVWPYLTRSEVGALDRTAIVLATIVVAWASTRWIEDPLRSGPWLRGGRRTFVASTTAMAFVAVAALGFSVQQSQAVELARDRAAATSAEDLSCLGPAALDPQNDCALGDSMESLLISPEAVSTENTDVVFPGCQAGLDAEEDATCTLGQRREPRGTIAAVGDSHTTHWFSALDAWGTKNGWRVVTYTRSSCPFTTSRRTLPDEAKGRYERCAAGNERILDHLAGDPSVSAVVTSTYSAAYGWTDDQGNEGIEALENGVDEVADRLGVANQRLIVIRDVPLVKDKKNAPDCLATTGSVAQCSLSQPDAVVPDVYAEAAIRLDLPVVDLTNRLCTESTCPVVVGDVIVFRDYSHLSADYSRLLAPALGDKLAPLLRP